MELVPRDTNRKLRVMFSCQLQHQQWQLVQQSSKRLLAVQVLCVVHALRDRRRVSRWTLDHANSRREVPRLLLQH